MGGRGGSSGISGADRDIEKITDWLDGESNSKGKLNPINIEEYKGQSLEQIEGRIRMLKHEELFAFDSNDELIAAFKGDENSVSFPETLLHVQDATVTHGHPKGLAEFGGTFSFADINNMLKSNWKEHRATASGQGEMNYIMRRMENADAQGLRDRINKDYVQLKESLADTYRAEYKKTLESGTKKHAKHIARQMSVGILNAYYKKTFEQYGYEYITRKEGYKYNR